MKHPAGTRFSNRAGRERYCKAWHLRPHRVPPPATISYCMGKRVSLFVTCMVDQLFPQGGHGDGARSSSGSAMQVDFPEDQTCCGQPAFNSGYRAEARTVARHFLEDLRSERVHRGAVRLLHGHGGPPFRRAVPQGAGDAGARAGAGSARLGVFHVPHRGGRRGGRGRALRRRGHLSRRLPRPARAGRQGALRAGCWRTCAAWNCARCSRPRNAAASAARSR